MTYMPVASTSRSALCGARPARKGRPGVPALRTAWMRLPCHDDVDRADRGRAGAIDENGAADHERLERPAALVGASSRGRRERLAFRRRLYLRRCLWPRCGLRPANQHGAGDQDRDDGGASHSLTLNSLNLLNLLNLLNPSEPPEPPEPLEPLLRTYEPREPDVLRSRIRLRNSGGSSAAIGWRSACLSLKL